MSSSSSSNPAVTTSLSQIRNPFNFESEASWTLNLESGWPWFANLSVNTGLKKHCVEDSLSRGFALYWTVRRKQNAGEMELETRIAKLRPLHAKKEDKYLAASLNWSYGVKVNPSTLPDTFAAFARGFGVFRTLIVLNPKGSWAGRFGSGESFECHKSKVDLPRIEESPSWAKRVDADPEREVLVLRLSFRLKVNQTNVATAKLGLDVVVPCSGHLLDKLSKDIKIKCGAEEFQVHKLVLCCCSEVFTRMFEGQLYESVEGCVEINDFEPVTVKDLISFLYDGQVTASSKESLVALLDCAEKYEIVPLKALVLQKMISSLNADNATEFAAASFKYRADEKIKTAMFDYCKANFAMLTTSDEFKKFLKENVDLFL